MAFVSVAGLAGGGLAARSQKVGKTVTNTVSGPEKYPAQPAVQQPAQEETAPAVDSTDRRKQGKKIPWSGGASASAAAAPSGSYKATYVDGGGSRRTGVVADTYYDDMRDSYRQNYDEQVAANNAAADQAAERARQSAAEQRAALNAEYQGTNRQLYRDYKEQERLLPQQMAARGYGGGLSESSQLRLRNSYEEGLNQNERSRVAQEAKINSALSQQEYETRAAADRANAQARQNMYGYLTQLQAQKHQQDRADAAQRAALLAAAGDYSGYRALGYSEGEIAYLSSMWGARNPLLQGSQSYGHYSDEGKVKTTAAWQVANYLRKVYGADAAVDYVAEELAAGNIFSDEADALRNYLRNGE